MADKDKWVRMSQSILKAELRRRGVGYRELAEKLTAMGTPETDRNIANKISRGGFTAAFFIECLRGDWMSDSAARRSNRPKVLTNRHDVIPDRHLSLF